MPVFTRFTKSDEAPVVPQGWLYVAYNGAKIKIVDSKGNSMAPYSRALVDGSDSMIKMLVADGVLSVLVEGTVPPEDYAEVVTEDGSVKEKLALLKQVVATPNTEMVGEPPVEATEEQIAEKETAKKTRKKKYVDTEASVAEQNEEIPADTQEISNDESNTSAQDETPSV
jgi:hypothetical protein